MNILITGANGQLGRTFMDVSEGYKHKCIFTSYRKSEYAAALDITDAAAVMEALVSDDVDIIINCAGYTDVAKAEDEQDRAAELNVHGPAVLAEAAKAKGALLIHFSTDYVFDGENNAPYRESDGPNPQNVYAQTKYDGERAIVESGCKYMIFRTSWLYSCHGRNFFKTIEDKASRLTSISVVDDQVGTPTYAVDLAQAVFRIIDSGKSDRTGLYHYSGEGICSWYDFADAINRGFGYTCDVLPCSTGDYPSNVRRPAYSVLDKSHFKNTFGIELPRWEDSLAVCIAEFLGK